MKIFERYINLYIAFLKVCFLNELEYRVNFIAGTFLGLFWAILSVLSISLVSENAGVVANWSKDEAVLLALIYYVANSFFQAVFKLNSEALSADIRNGNLDTVFTKPVDIRFASFLRQFDYSEFVRFAVFLIGTIIYVYKVMPSVRIFDLAVGLVLTLIGSLSIACMDFLINCYSFWKPSVWNLRELSSEIRHLSAVSSDVYRGILKQIVYILPIAASATIPAKFILGRGTWFLFIFSIAQFLILAFLLNTVWKLGVKQYESASS
jgi:ABC-2 type transport system permease protein